MSANVEPSDWTYLDPWWEAYAETQSVAQHSTYTRIFGLQRLAQQWQEIDSWARTYVESIPATQGATSPQGVGLNHVIDRWEELDPWWDVYTETGHETAIQICELIAQSNDVWKHSDGPFETDPLAADFTRKRCLRGPLQPSGELKWSQWLAQLLGPSDALIRELFEVPVEQPPSEVVREARLPNRDGGFRRADIVVCHAEHGISIEVKLDDENYGKTAETAKLVERHYDQQEWEHVLLLPRRQKRRLDTIVSPSLRSCDNGQLQIAWDDPGPITVLYWRDVAAAIRSILRRGDVVDDHWAANAYLFCSVVEQELIGFQSQPALKRMADPACVVDTIQPIFITNTLEEQLTYLQFRLNS